MNNEKIRNIENRLDKLEKFNKSRKNSQLIIIGLIILIFTAIFSITSINDKIGPFVEEKTLIKDNNKTTTYTHLVKIKDSNKTNKVYLRDSTPIYYGFFIILALILILIIFNNREYKEVENE